MRHIYLINGQRCCCLRWPIHRTFQLLLRLSLERRWKEFALRQREAATPVRKLKVTENIPRIVCRCCQVDEIVQPLSLLRPFFLLLLIEVFFNVFDRTFLFCLLPGSLLLQLFFRSSASHSKSSIGVGNMTNVRHRQRHKETHLFSAVFKSSRRRVMEKQRTHYYDFITKAASCFELEVEKLIDSSVPERKRGKFESFVVAQRREAIKKNVKKRNDIASKRYEMKNTASKPSFCMWSENSNLAWLVQLMMMTMMIIMCVLCCALWEMSRRPHPSASKENNFLLSLITFNWKASIATHRKI